MEMANKIHLVNQFQMHKPVPKAWMSLDSPKQGPYPITDLYTKVTVRIQRGAVNERINIRRLEPHF